MSRKSLFSQLFAAAALVVALPLTAGDALTLVPLDATTVGMVHLTDLRTSPITGRLFAEADKASVDGEAARFMAETGLRPTEDVDAFVVALSPDTDGKGNRVLVGFEGRFDAVKLAKAFVTRGGTAKVSPAGAYYLVPDSSHTDSDTAGPAAVAFVNNSLVLAGTESSVVQALTDRRSGGSDFWARAALGHEKHRIAADATSWILVDVPRSARYGATPEVNNGMAGNLTAALKNVAVVAVWATDSKDSIKVGGSAVSYDAETRDLLTDTLKGVLAAWRMAAQEKAPELVSELRKFEVSKTDDAVTLNGTVSGELIKTWASKAQSYQKASK